MGQLLKSGLYVAGLVLGAGLGAALAQERIEPCAAYQNYVDMGIEESPMASALARVCAYIGPQMISQPCLVYYTRVSDEFLVASAEQLEALAQECEASMPGGSALQVGGNCRDRDCREPDPVLVPQPDPGPGADPDPGPDPGPGAGPDPGPGAGPDPGPDPGPSDSMECGSGNVECLAPDAPEMPDPAPTDTGAANNAAAAAATPNVLSDAAALDLAFWESIKDSDNPALYRAYLDKFPDGVFAVIALERLKAAGAPVAGAPVVAAPATTGPTPPPSVLPPLGDDPDGAAALAQANAIMDEAYASDGGDWDGAARLAIPLYRMAGEKGQAAAWLMLGDLYESGIGVAVDNDQALAFYRLAAETGTQDGYSRALLLLDQVGQDADFADVFLDYYRVAPAMALDELAGMSLNAARAVQARLKHEGYYTGALDGAFGPDSRAALQAFMSGAPKPVVTNTQTPPAQAPDAVLAAEIQQELARLGCYDGKIDGKWGPESARAMRNFNHWNGDDGETAFPTRRALKLVTIALAPVCGID